MKIALTAAAVTLTASAASAGTPWSTSYEDSFLAFGAEMPFGDGNMNQNYTIARNTDSFGSIEVGLKAKERFIGDLTTDGAGRYFADAGSPNNDGRASWNIDYGFALPQPAVPANYTVLLNVDFDAGFGTQSWVTLDITQTLENFVQSVNSGGDSQNLDFGFWGTSTSGLFALELDASGHIAFDADALGEYDMNMEVYDAAGALLARSPARRSSSKSYPPRAHSPCSGSAPSPRPAAGVPDFSSHINQGVHPTVDPFLMSRSNYSTLTGTSSTASAPFGDFVTIFTPSVLRPSSPKVTTPLS